jgi:hypothetical protein
MALPTPEITKSCVPLSHAIRLDQFDAVIFCSSDIENSVRHLRRHVLTTVGVILIALLDPFGGSL